MSVWDRDLGTGEITATGLEQQQEWLSEDNEKIVICDIVHHTGTEEQIGYFSNFPYITPFGDSWTDLLGNTASNVPYIDNLINIPNMISRIDSDINIGALEFLNAHGEFDNFISYAWEGHPLEIRIGNKNWIKSDFILILGAVASVITSPRPNIMSLNIRDKKEVFKIKVQEQLITEDYITNPTTGLYYDGYDYTGDPPLNPAFSQLLDNFLSLSIGIEVRIADTTDDATQIAIATEAAMKNAAVDVDITRSTNVITMTQILTGTIEATHDGDGTSTTYNTGFSFNTGTPETITVTGYGGDAATLKDKYFHFHSPYRNYYVWYNINAGDSDFESFDPELVERSKEQFDPTSIRIPDTIVNTPVPICVGKCLNIEPKLIDSNNHIYQVHEGPIESVIEVRANGVPLSPPNSATPQYEVNEDIGCFRLLVHQNSTQITCDVIGARDRGQDSAGDSGNFSVTAYSAPWIVEWLALEKTSLLAADLCAVNFTAFDNISPLGLYVKDETEVSGLITDVMASVGGFARFGRVCVLQLIKLEDPEFLDVNINIDEDSIVEKGLSLQATEVPKNSITLGFDKNWTVQDKGSLAGLITDPSSDFLHLLDVYSNEFSKVVANNTDIRLEYPLAEDADEIGTFITDFPSTAGGTPTTNAQDEVDRRIRLRSKKRFIYKVKTTVAPFTVSLGDVVFLTHKRFGFQFGRNCLIIGMDEKPTKQRVDLEVWI